MPEQFDSFLEKVCQQIRWKRAQSALIKELRTHLLDQKDAYISEGMDDKTAEEETLHQMGDPVEVGAELDRVHRPIPQWGLLILAGALTIVGAFLRTWLTAGWEYDRTSPVRACAALIIGFTAMTACYLLDFTTLMRYARQIYIGAILAVILLINISPVINNVPYYARYACLLLPTVYACWLGCWRLRGWKGMACAILGVFPLAVLAVLVPYLMGFFVFIVVSGVLLLIAAWQDWFGIGKKKTLGSVIGLEAAGAIAALYLVRMKGLWRTRIAIVFHPEIDPLGSGFTALRIKSALRGANLLGEGTLVGLQASDGEYTYHQLVPAAGSDTFLTTLIHKLGWIPLLLLIGCFIVLLLWMIRRCMKQQNLFGTMIALSVVLSLGLQAILSILYNLSFTLLPAHFPLLIGNLHTEIDLALIGLALSVFRGEKLPANIDITKESKRTTKSSRIKYEDGELIIQLRKNESFQ